MCCATPLLWHRMPPLRGVRLFACWTRTFERRVVTYRWRDGRNSRTSCKGRSSSRRSSPHRELHLPTVCASRLDIWKPRRLQAWSTLKRSESRLREGCEVLRATAHSSSEHAGQYNFVICRYYATCL